MDIMPARNSQHHRTSMVALRNVQSQAYNISDSPVGPRGTLPGLDSRAQDSELSFATNTPILHGARFFRSRERSFAMKIFRYFWASLFLLGFCLCTLAVESGMYRLLSVSDSEKLILISQIPGKHKYLLDASSAKITVNGKPAEFKELKAFSTIQVKLELRKATKNGVALDGAASEIRIGSDIEKHK
jgi:hypothetical protein